MPWKITSSSVRGVQHKSDNIPCQDFSDCYYLPSDDLGIGVVVDGAGSARLSHMGAKCSVSKALPHLKKLASQLKEKKLSDSQVKQLFRTMIDAILSELHSKADIYRCSIDDFACTFLAFIATSDWLTAIQIGDGFIAYKTKDNDNYDLLFMPQKGEFENETVFVTSKDAFENAHFFNGFKNLEFICASTDGIDHASLNKTRGRKWSPHPAFFEPLRAELERATSPESFAEEIATFLDSEVFAKITGDDKTIILALYQDFLNQQAWDHAYSFRSFEHESRESEPRYRINLPEYAKKRATTGGTPAGSGTKNPQVDNDLSGIGPIADHLCDQFSSSYNWIHNSPPFSNNPTNYHSHPEQRRCSRNPLDRRIALFTGLLVVLLLTLALIYMRSPLLVKESSNPALRQKISDKKTYYIKDIFAKQKEEFKPVGFLVNDSFIDLDETDAVVKNRGFKAWLYLTNDEMYLDTKVKTVAIINDNQLRPVFQSKKSSNKETHFPIGYVFPGSSLSFIEDKPIRPSNRSELEEKAFRVLLYLQMNRPSYNQ